MRIMEFGYSSASLLLLRDEMELLLELLLALDEPDSTATALMRGLEDVLRRGDPLGEKRIVEPLPW